MILQAEFEIEKAASKDETRRPLLSPWLLGKRLVATDGKILAAIVVDRDEKDVDGPVTVEALKAARKSGRKMSMAALEANGVLKDTLGGASFPRPDLGQFPNWVALVPKRNRPEIEIAIDANLLAKLAAALGSDGLVRLRIPVDKDGDPEVKVYRVEAVNGPGKGKRENIGLLMPARG